MYTAELKIPRMSRDQKQKRCDEIISLLQLDKCRKTIIGNVLKRGISGGQAKRVNIALALITRPRVIFLDEPTSGLDSRMANEVCVLLAQLAKEGCTVVATIHAPTSFAFSLFHDLLMLQSGGRIIYNGQVSGVRAYFEGQGHKFPEEIGYSLPDWLVDTTSGACGNLQVSTLDQAEAEVSTDFAMQWEKSQACAEHASHLASTISACKEASDLNRDFYLSQTSRSDPCSPHSPGLQDD